ncbi:MAG: hypothetical protein AAGD11_10520 [Planctomycetota bacterium]
MPNADELYPVQVDEKEGYIDSVGKRSDFLGSIRSEELEFAIS